MNKQSGSSVGYVVVAVLLVILALGGVWLLKSGIGSSDVKPQPEGVVKEQKKDSNSDKSKNNKDKSKTDKKVAKKDTEELKKKDEIRQREESKKAEAAREEANRINNSDKSQRYQTSQGAQVQIPRTGATLPTDSSNLPQTGPAQSILSMAIGAIAIFLSGYMYYHYGYPKQNRDY